MRLTTVKADEVGQWSPNGEYLLFTVHTGDRKGIYKRNPDGVNEERLTTESDSTPIWSPDSKRIAFISVRDGNKEIYVMNSDGLEARRHPGQQCRNTPRQNIPQDVARRIPTRHRCAPDGIVLLHQGRVGNNARAKIRQGFVYKLQHGPLRKFRPIQLRRCENGHGRAHEYAAS